MDRGVQSGMVKKNLDCFNDLIPRFAITLEIIPEQENSFSNL